MKEKKYPLIGRERFEEYQGNLKTSSFDIAGTTIGTEKPLIIAGPCTVHSRQQTLESAHGVKAAGADLLRGGAFKPRTSPYSFQGLGVEGLKILAEARKETGLPIVTEVLDTRDVKLVGKYADMLQIGCRNMQNYPLLTEVGRYAAQHEKGVLLKTGPLPKLDEVLSAAEYIALEFEKQQKTIKLILCERGVNIPANSMRNTPRPEFLAELRRATFLPVIGDPSHSAGDRELVPQVGKDYLNAGANGLIIDILGDHEKPVTDDGVEVCDYQQGLRMSEFKKYLESLQNHRVPQ